MSFCIVIVSGKLVRDCELKYSQNGKAVLQNAVAFERYIAATQKRETSFLDFMAFGKTAENIQRFFSKGSHIILYGGLEQASWTDKTGQKHSKIRMIVENFDFCGSKPQQQQQQQQQQPQTFDFDNPPF